MKPFLTIYMWKGTLEDICDLYVRRKRVSKGKMRYVRGNLFGQGGWKDKIVSNDPAERQEIGSPKTEFDSPVYSYFLHVNSRDKKFLADFIFFSNFFSSCIAATCHPVKCGSREVWTQPSYSGISPVNPRSARMRKHSEAFACPRPGSPPKAWPSGHKWSGKLVCRSTVTVSLARILHQNLFYCFS